MLTQELTPIVPCIRSSDYSLCDDELLYYLSRRLGLTPFLHDSEALCCGGWFHERARVMEEPMPLDETTCLLHERMIEIRTEASDMGVGFDATQTIIDNERKYHAQAMAWFEASSKIMVPDFNVTFPDYINAGAFEIIGREIVIAVLLPDFPETPIVVQIDVLRRHKKSGIFVIDDYKTTAYHPSLRIITCPYEFQTWLYPEILQAFLDGYPSWCSNPNLTKMIDEERASIKTHSFSYPALKVGMMSHIIIQKPTIKFGMTDRYFDYVSAGKRKKIYAELSQDDIKDWVLNTWNYPEENLGKDAPEIIYGSLLHDEMFSSFSYHESNLAGALSGMHEQTGKTPSKVYIGEPSIDRHIERVDEWYQGTGDFIDEASEREDEPPVAISQTMRLSPKERNTLRLMIAKIYNQAIRHPDDACCFLFNAKNMTNRNTKSYWADFYGTEPEDWPEVVERHKFKVKRREPAEAMQWLQPKNWMDNPLNSSNLNTFPLFFS